MAEYGSPETDKMMNDLMDKVFEYEKEGDYQNAMATLDKVITSLELLDKEHKDSINKAVVRAERRDRQLYKKILRMKEKQREMENRIDNLVFKIQKIDEIVNIKSEGK
ncbi:MAG: hypothetical protein QQN64_06510 [Nitrosopumilus sp.]|nr:hypothetical protein [Nitrososphaerota archaeon]